MKKEYENVTNEEERKEETPVIIAIGASAGGVEALQLLFECMPDNSGFVFVVIQHLSPDYKSLMADILKRNTRMEIYEAEENISLRPNTIYLNPAKTYLSLTENRTLHLTQVEAGTLNHPIDAFFDSLAERELERSVAVVLSGTGSDGTNGIKKIKERGGLVIAQELSSAKFDGMPRSVIATGLADFILPPEGIVEELLNFSEAPTLLAVKNEDGNLSDDDIFSTEEESLGHIYAILKGASKIDFTYYKRSTILRRIERRMIVTHTKTLAEFARMLSEHPEEVSILVKEILIGVTNFFRDSMFFEALKEYVVYPVIERTGENEAIRIWSAGCSTGEEAYSVAILFKEALEDLNVKRDIKIFATDVDDRAVEAAGKGIYPESIEDDVSSERLMKYFKRQNEHYIVSKEIRRMIIFASHNMFSDPPFGKLDLIVCRNVMIYFQPLMRRGMFSIFNTALKKDGYLFLGKSETASEYISLFKPVCSMEKIYVHTGKGKIENFTPPAFNVPDVQAIQSREVYPGRRTVTPVPSEEIYTRFLESRLPASAILDADNNVVHFFGNHKDYFTFASGKATLNFFQIVHPDLSLAASTAISRCREEKRILTYTDIAVDCADGRRVINLEVEPVRTPYGDDSGMVAVLFIESGTEKARGDVEKYDINKTAARRIADLEREFNVSQNDLRATIQRLETVNGELQAANEELLTANEELQSSTEELQSVNEELYTVNTEHQLKLDELTTITNDLSNFLSSTMIGILFVDSRLNIRKFTEYVGREFQLMEHDVGRPVRIFAHSFPDERIEEDCREVLKNLLSIDREVTALNGRFYTLRIAPYRTTENNIRGLVITIIDSLGAEGKMRRNAGERAES
ncbi:MAG: CheR family methyltransferase [Eubacteriales bacterium]|nr:CheR family methyltransferase [Eubacteriales bacterium]